MVIAGLVATLLGLVGGTIGAVNHASNIFALWALVSYLTFTATILFFAFITPFAMVNFAVCEQVAAGFDFKTILGRIKKNSKVFLLAWLLSIGVGWTSMLLPAITVVGIFLTPTTVFIGYLFTALLAAKAWGADDRAVVETTTVPFKVSR